MNEYIISLEKAIQDLQKEEEVLVSTSRKDEANLVRIKSNICDVCKTIYNVHSKTKSGNELREEYIRQLTRLEENWKMSLDKAREHDDVEKIVIEETKLEMMKMIRAKYDELGVSE